MLVLFIYDLCLDLIIFILQINSRTLPKSILLMLCFIIT